MFGFPTAQISSESADAVNRCQRKGTSGYGRKLRRCHKPLHCSSCNSQHKLTENGGNLRLWRNAPQTPKSTVGIVNQHKHLAFHWVDEYSSTRIRSVLILLCLKEKSAARIHRYHKIHCCNSQPTPATIFPSYFEFSI